MSLNSLRSKLAQKQLTEPEHDNIVCGDCRFWIDDAYGWRCCQHVYTPGGIAADKLHWCKIFQPKRNLRND